MNRITVRFTYVMLSLLFWAITACTPKIYQVDPEKNLREMVSYLSSEELEGRKSGEKGDSLAAIYIRDRMKVMEMKLMYDRGFQPFSLISSVTLGPSNHLQFNNERFEVTKDFLPYSFSSPASFTGEIVFAGYGFDIQTDSLKWNDYGEVDVTGKWVLLLKGDPEIEKSESIFEAYSDVRAKVLAAIDHKAAGVLLTGGPNYSEKDQLQDLFYDKNSSTYSIPVFQVTRQLADKFLNNKQLTVAEIEAQINADLRPASFQLDGKVTGKADVLQKTVKSNNVVGLVEGNDPHLKNEYIVIGAHYDHLGWGGPGSGSRATDTVGIHYGADDNASGVAMVLELARKAALEKQTRRSLVFAAFGAEEMGLIGSKAFVSEPPVDLKKVNAMFNFDMVGRLDTASRALSIGGTLTSRETEQILTENNQGFQLAFSGDGVGPSDHAAFYVQNIPVFFFSTGAHSDYHTPGDDASRLNYSGIREISDYSWQVIKEVANRDSSLTFQEAGSKIQRSRGGRFKVTLGVMPDYAGMEKTGMRIDAVTKGKPAEKAGMLKGDIITAIDGKPVGNIYDYMNRLQNFSEGQTISVDIIRNGKPMVLIVQL